MATDLGTIAENIALLGVLKHNEPVSTNAAPVLPDDLPASRRTLTLHHEEQIAKAFALLLVNTSDKSKVGAVCVEEDPSENSLTLRTATNTGSQESRKTAFHRIAVHLKQVSRDRDIQMHENELMDTVVDVCQTRILARLRSKHAPRNRKSKRGPLVPKLQLAANLLRTHRCHFALLEDLEHSVATLTNTFAVLESLHSSKARGLPGRRILKNLLANIANIFSSTERYSSWLVDSLPKRVQELECIDLPNLVERFQKLAQYEHAAKDLLYLARRYPVFRDLRVEEVSIGPSSSTGIGHDLPRSRRGVLSAYLGSENVEERTRNVLVTKNEHEMAQLCAGVIEMAKEERRVHAEVQLLFHYNARGEMTAKPRVICSEKKACFLCNAFIIADGRFYTPDSHGTLYYRWMLPSCQEVAQRPSSQILRRFNKKLESAVFASLSRGPHKQFSVAESVLFLPGSFTPSNLSAADRHEATVECKSDDAHASQSSISEISSGSSNIHIASAPAPRLGLVEESHEGSDRSLPPSTIESTNNVFATEAGAQTSDCISTAREPSMASLVTERERNTEGQLQYTSDDSDPSSVQVNEQYTLSKGSRVTIHLPHGSTTRISTSCIHLTIDHVLAASLASSDTLVSDQPLVLLIECLEATVAEQTGNDRNVIDLGASMLLNTLPEGALFQERGILLRKKDELISLRASDMDSATRY